MSIRGLSPTELVRLAIGGNRAAVGRLLTLVESAGEPADALAELAQPLSSGAHILGITGPPGSGKSTLVSRLVAAAVHRGDKPAVLAVDPSSPLTGGAILGDRVRMADIDDGAFIRSLATRGHSGGLAVAIPGAIRVLDSVGYSPIIIETVGVGQVEVDVAATADTTVVVVTPGMGDAVQANKAGLLEVADIFVVNKADQPGAKDARRDLELMLELSHMTGQQKPSYRPPILETNSLSGEGVSAVLAAIAAHVAYLDDSGERLVRAEHRIRFEIETRLSIHFRRALESRMAHNGTDDLVLSVAAGDLSIVEAVNQLSISLLNDTAQT